MMLFSNSFLIIRLSLSVSHYLKNTSITPRSPVDSRSPLTKTSKCSIGVDWVTSTFLVLFVQCELSQVTSMYLILSHDSPCMWASRVKSPSGPDSAAGSPPFELLCLSADQTHLDTLPPLTHPGAHTTLPHAFERIQGVFRNLQGHFDSECFVFASFRGVFFQGKPKLSCLLHRVS